MFRAARLISALIAPLDKGPVNTLVSCGLLLIDYFVAVMSGIIALGHLINQYSTASRVTPVNTSPEVHRRQIIQQSDEVNLPPGHEPPSVQEAPRPF